MGSFSRRENSSMICRRFAACALLWMVFWSAPAGAVVCARKSPSTGEPREGAPLKLRSACRVTEIAIAPGLLGAGEDTIGFASESVIGGTATLYLSIGGRISTDEAAARTPLGSGVLGGLRCYLSAASGGGGLDVAVGVGDCGATLSFVGTPALAFSGTEGELAKDSGTSEVPLSEGQCVSLRVNTLGMVAPAYLTCTLERRNPPG
jgi:hypothetical protein